MLHRYPKRVVVIMLVLTAIVALFPLWGPAVFGARSDFMMERMTLMLILALFAMSLDLLVGIVGLVSLGHALFFGLGAYTLALASPAFSPASIWWMAPLVMLVSALAALAVGCLVIRTRGIFFIMTTLAFGQMLYHFVNTSRHTGGTDGIFIMFRPSVELGGTVLLDLDDPLTFFYVCLSLVFLGYLFLRWLTRSFYGQVLDGIHDNEHRMEALGYATGRYKLVAFVISGVMASLAGMLAAMQYGFANPTQLGWHTSGEVLMMLILGGMGTIFGPILGAFAYEILQHTFEHMTSHWPILMGITIILAVLILPRGIAGLIIDPPSRATLLRWLKRGQAAKASGAAKPAASTPSREG